MTLITTAFLTAALPYSPTHPHSLCRPAVEPRTPCFSLAPRRSLVMASNEAKPDDTSDDSAALPPSETPSPPPSDRTLGFVGAPMLGISFVCTANGCNTRISKQIKRRSYEQGTVLIRCPTCLKHHVIADNHGMYSSLTGGKKNIEEIARNAGQAVTRVDSSTFALERLVSTVLPNEEGAGEDDASESSQT